MSHHTLDWTELPWTVTHPRPTEPVDPPRHFGEMIRIAERLGTGFDHVRVDMYECDDKIYVGEMTVYSYSGLHPIQPELGRLCVRVLLESPPPPVTSSLDHPGEKARDTSTPGMSRCAHALAVNACLTQRSF